MPPRDPRIEPMPGDVLRARNGAVWRVVDEFVSVLRSGQERVGLRVIVERRGARKIAYVGPAYLRRTLAKAAVVRRSRRTKLRLKNAPRVRHTEDDAALEAAFAERLIRDLR